MAVLITIIILGVMVISHEFGHYIVAVRSGVEVEEFSIGFGPILLKKQTKHTLLTLRAFPLGGFCRMPEENGKSGYYDVKPIKRILLSLAGPVMNLLMAVLIFFTIFLISGTHATTTIKDFAAISPAREAGIEIGDTIVGINEAEITSWEQVSNEIDASGGQSISVSVKTKQGQIKSFTITPYKGEDGSYLIGITAKSTFKLGYAVVNSFKMVGTFVALMFEVIVGLFRGLYGMEAFSGPIGVAVTVGEYMSYGVASVLYIAAAISVSVGVFNLLPLPALDGGKILFSLIEVIIRKPVSRKVEGTLSALGMVLLMALAAFVAYSDIVNYL